MIVSHVYASYDGKTVLSDISFKAPQACVSCVLGANGVGKSTLFQILAALKKADCGTVMIDEDTLALSIESLKHKERARLIAYIPQKTDFVWDCTVFEVVLQGRFAYTSWDGSYSAHDRDIALHQVERLSLSDLKNRSIHTLSGGELQRVLIARALSQEPRILLLDEPVSGLDIAHQYAVLENIHHLAESGLTVIMSLHDLNLTGIFADRIILLQKGQVLASDIVERVFTEQYLTAAYGIPITISEHPLRKKPQILV